MRGGAPPLLADVLSLPATPPTMARCWFIYWDPCGMACFTLVRARSVHCALRTAAAAHIIEPARQSSARRGAAGGPGCSVRAARRERSAHRWVPRAPLRACLIPPRPSPPSPRHARAHATGHRHGVAGGLRDRVLGAGPVAGVVRRGPGTNGCLPRRHRRHPHVVRARSGHGPGLRAARHRHGGGCAAQRRGRAGVDEDEAAVLPQVPRHQAAARAPLQHVPPLHQQDGCVARRGAAQREGGG